MILYTCNQKDHGPHQLHPCGKAGHALKEAGYEYEIKTKKGYTLMPWTWGSRKSDRADVEKWFKRNCNDVLKRACTAQEKGDFMAYVLSVK